MQHDLVVSKKVTKCTKVSEVSIVKNVYVSELRPYNDCAMLQVKLKYAYKSHF